jgi:hypothetical protein
LIGWLADPHYMVHVMFPHFLHVHVQIRLTGGIHNEKPHRFDLN